MDKSPKAQSKPANPEPGKFRRTYARAGRLMHRALTPFMQLVLREKHVRVRALILNEEKEVLLVRSWFSHQRWSLPGGGIGQTESPAEAAIREIHEETGIRVPLEDLQELGSFPNPDPKNRYTIACYTVTVPKRAPRLARHRKLEMLDAGWFLLANLPKERSETVDTAIALLS